MRNALDERFEALRQGGRCGFIPYLMGGDPTPQESLRLMQVAATAGADVLEIGFPFSDPVADGPTIQAAGLRALRAGTTTSSVLEMASELSMQTDVPLVAMAYLNPIVRYGSARFAEDARAAGFSGVIVPDLPFSEREVLLGTLRGAGLHLCPLVAPTTPPERLRAIAESTDGGFIYAVSVTGVTGARASVDARAQTLLDTLAEASRVPRALGFGIKDAEMARRYRQSADAVVVGSALIDRHGGSAAPAALSRLHGLCRELSEALHA